MRMIPASILSTLCATVLVVGCSSAAPSDPIGTTAQDLNDDGIDSDMHVHWQQGHGGGTSSTNLIDHGGKILPTSNTYAIWWGTASAFPADAQSGIDSLFSGLEGTAFLSVANQYMRGGTENSSFHTNLFDSSSPPGHGPKTSAIVSEACKVIGANGLTPDSSAIYFVYTSNFPGHVSYCAYHGHGSCNGVDIQVAYMPNTSGIAGCDPGNLYNCNGYSQGTRSLGNVTSHEYMEAITDPDLNAWYDSSGSEIGDKCAWQFSSCVNLKNGNWQLQKEWSNSASGCVQQ
jgi:hypothetical protein